MIKTKTLNNNLGMSLIEVMIVMTIMSLIGLGTATLMKNMFSIQRRGSLKAVAKELKNNLEVVLKNDTSWAHAVNNNASLACLRDSVAPPGTCPHTPYNNTPNAPNAPYSSDIEVFNIDGTTYFDGTSAAEGWDAESGGNCSSFDITPGSGDDACPFRYTTYIYTECPNGVAPCRKPQITVVALLSFNPADPSDPRNRLNTADYTITLKRGERSRYEPLEIQYSETNASGGGSCPAAVNNPGPRPLNAASEYDVGGNIVGINGPAGEFTLGPGTYECKIVAQGYEAIDGFTVQLNDITNGVPGIVSGSAYCGFNSSCFATGTGTFELTANATLELTHTCGSDASGESSDRTGTPGEGFEMGIPSINASGSYAGGTGTVYTSITCVRSS